MDVLLPTGGRVLLPPGCPNARTFHVAGMYETKLTQWWLTHIPPRATVVDVGAYVGYYTVMACALVGRWGHVVAVEPHPDAYAYLMRNLARNGCANATPYRCAVGDREGKVRLSGDWLTGRAYAVPDDAGDVACVPLDDVVPRQVDVVRLDIGGGEVRALAGMRKLVARHRRMVLVMAYNRTALVRHGHDEIALGEQLASIGFGHVHILERGMRPVPLPSGLPHTTVLLTLVGQAVRSHCRVCG